MTDDAAGLLAQAAAMPGARPVGQSRAGVPLWGCAFAVPTAGRPLLLVAGVHGDEPSGVAGVLALVQALARGPGPPRPLFVVPAMNPDGLLRKHKDNGGGVDLNRNFPAANFSPTHAPGYFPGLAPASEPETQAIVALVDSLDPVAVVAVHAPFACVNYDGPAESWARQVAAACGWPVQADIGYPTPGSLGSWLGRERGLPVLTLEFPPGAYAAFRAPAQAALQAAVAHAPTG